MRTAGSPEKKSPSRGAVGVFLTRILHRGLHTAAVGITSLALLAPFFGGVIPLLLDESSTCSMSCCKTSKSCCCHMSGAAGQPGSAWTAAGRCPTGCGLRPGVPGYQAVGIAALIVIAGFLWKTGLLPLFAIPGRNSAILAFALFERPPPTVCA